jgi:hypothetical protein
VNSTVTHYTTGAVTSADGTTISFRQLGSGPGLIVLSGGYLSAQYYMELAAALADAFTVPARPARAWPQWPTRCVVLHGQGMRGCRGPAY